MGMYTQLHIGTRLKSDLPIEVKDVLDYMVGNTSVEPSIEKFLHPLFSKATRWSYMLQGDSYYFDYKTTSKFALATNDGFYWFNVTCNFKNYNNEIILFLDWLYQYIDEDIDEKDFIGYSRYEENQIPNLIFKGNMTQSV